MLILMDRSFSRSQNFSDSHDRVVFYYVFLVLIFLWEVLGRTAYFTTITSVAYPITTVGTTQLSTA